MTSNQGRMSATCEDQIDNRMRENQRDPFRSFYGQCNTNTRTCYGTKPVTLSQ